MRIIVPQAPGDPCDTFARLLGQKMSERLGQQVVVDRRGVSQFDTGSSHTRISGFNASARAMPMRWR